MSCTIPLDIRTIMKTCPIDRNLKPAEGVNRETTFTFFPNVVDSSSVPAYTDTSHLAAWLVGYWAGQEEVAERRKEGDK